MAMVAGIGSAIGGALAGAASSMFGGGGGDPSGVIDDAAMKQSMSQTPPDTGGISSVMQGANPPAPGAAPAANLSGSQAPKSPSISDMAADAGKKLLNGAFSTASNEAGNALIQHLFHRNDAAKAGKNTKDYLAAAFPNMNEWERAGAGGSMAGVQEQQFSQTKQLAKMQLDNQKDIAKMQMDNQLKIAGIGSVTSRQNTADQVYAQNSMLDNNKRESNARINNILASTDLSVSQKAEVIARIVKTNLESQGVALTNNQIPVLTDEIKSRIDNIDTDTGNKVLTAEQIQATTNSILQDTENKSYGDSVIGKNWKSVKDVVPDAVRIAVPYSQQIINSMHKFYSEQSSNYKNAEGVQGSMSRK